MVLGPPPAPNQTTTVFGLWPSVLVFTLVFSVGLGFDLVSGLVTDFRFGYVFQVLVTGFRFDYSRGEGGGGDILSLNGKYVPRPTHPHQIKRIQLFGLWSSVLVFILVFCVGLGLDLVWGLIGFQFGYSFQGWVRVSGFGYRFQVWLKFLGFGYIFQVLVQFQVLVTHPPTPN